MARSTTLTISMPPSMAEFIRRRMAAKGYGNTSEYFRQLVRADRKQAEDEVLDRLLLQGLRSKRVHADEGWWQERHARLAAQLKRRKTA
ncbi:MAG: ribbon-helix-helix domain-containing protein [Phycisphaerales bacterium]